MLELNKRSECKTERKPEVIQMPKTKGNIFDTAVEMFAERGYDNVSMREITRMAGINESTAYYYYNSKESLLDEILSVYWKMLARYLITKEEVELYLETDTPRELLVRLFPSFQGEEAVFMQRANRIVCMQQYTNPRARDLVMDQLINKTTESIKDTLDILIERGLIPAFDTDSISFVWCNFLFAQSVKHANQFLNGDSEQLKISSFVAYGNALIDMAVTGRLPGAIL